MPQEAEPDGAALSWRQRQLDRCLHVGVYLGDGADAVVMGDREVVVQHPGGRAGLRPAAAVRGERMQMSNVPVRQQQIVT